MKALWSYNDCLTPEEVAKAIEIGESYEFVEGTVGDGSGDNYSVDKKTRDSLISWIPRADNPDAEWLFDKIDRSVRLMNEAWHGIRHFYQGVDRLQYTVYAEGHYYNSHIDSVLLPDGQPVRKVSCSVILSGPDEYDGGDMVVAGGQLERNQLKPGQIFVFPSIVNHQIAEVTRGKRISLVAWYMGPPWA